MQIKVPELSVVALIGVSSSGKSTFAKKHFKPTEILSSDFLRGVVSDDEGNQEATRDAFDSLYYLANKRMDRGLLTVIDATNVQKQAREAVLKLAREQNCRGVAIVFNLSEEICQERNLARPERQFPPYVIRNQMTQMKRSIKHLEKEGFRQVYVLSSLEEIEAAEIVRVPSWTSKKEEAGPFDVIGDVHGCYDELCELLEKLGYQIDKEGHSFIPPVGRRAIFLGDLCDRGPKNVAVLKMVMGAVKEGKALAVLGNHDTKLVKALQGKKVKASHGLGVTLEELALESEDFREEVCKFLDGLVSHYVLDAGRLVVAHGGIKEKYQGRSSGKVRNFCLYGETTGESDEYGLPVRLDWAEEYRGKALVLYGHTPTLEIMNVNNTYCIDTGCVFGGKLTGFRYPEREWQQVKAQEQYCEPAKPLGGTFQESADLLSIEDVQGERYIQTRLHKTIKIQKGNSVAALEIMSRFAIDPHWLIYLPPTMAPCETSGREEYLEYPSEGFEYFKKNGVSHVVCEEKHMGSRAVLVVCKDEETARRRFGVADASIGAIYTRTGRAFFNESELEKEALARLQKALSQSNFWAEEQTDWVCLDAEIMPWSAKAQGLLKEQYAKVGCAGVQSTSVAAGLLEKALKNPNLLEVEAIGGRKTVDLEALLAECKQQNQDLTDYRAAYRRYCWEVDSLSDYKIAPFHILGTEGRNWMTVNHMTHLEKIEKYIAAQDSLFMVTAHRLIDLSDEASIEASSAWWEELTGKGGEGMVIKPLNFIHQGSKELVQPAIKCRGREYLRIIYGPEYTKLEYLKRLKKRGLRKKSNLALREFALGAEALERFIQKEPLYRIHECVFAVLALESEPVDPRL